MRIWLSQWLNQDLSLKRLTPLKKEEVRVEGKSPKTKGEGALLGVVSGALGVVMSRVEVVAANRIFNPVPRPSPCLDNSREFRSGGGFKSTPTLGNSWKIR